MTSSERKRAAADRAREYRARQRKAARPSARIVDQALSEAMSFVIAQAGVFDRRPGEGVINVLAVAKTATAVLTREGYNKKLSASAIMARLSPRKEHTDTTYVPSLKPHHDPSQRLPDRIAPCGPRADCRPTPPPPPLRWLVKVDPKPAQVAFDADAFFDDWLSEA